MDRLTRRAALAMATTTLAVGGMTRKLRAEGEPSTDQIGQLQLRDPTVLPAGVRWQGADGASHGVADYAGQGLVLNFWATWCGPCVAEMPTLARLARSLAGDRIAVVAVSADAGGAGAVQRFYHEHAIAGLGVWLDPGQGAQNAGGVQGLPTTLIIDRRGREVGRVAGAVDWDAAAGLLRVMCNS